MTGRGILAVGILAAWGVGIAVYTQRELTRSPRAKLAEIAARVGPGATYFAVESGGRHVGFASNTIDTIPGALQVTDYVVADLPVRGVEQHTRAQSVVKLSRGLALREFTLSVSSDSLTSRTTGRMVGDSLLELVQLAGDAADTSRLRVAGPLLLPTLVPLVIALGDPPAVGRRYTMTTFDPVALQVRTLPLTVAAESLFVVVDSAAFNASAQRWDGAHADTVRGFHVVADSAGAFDSWVDEQGRMIAAQATPQLTMRRTAYEIAFENWYKRSAHGARRGDDDVRTVGRAGSGESPPQRGDTGMAGARCTPRPDPRRRPLPLRRERRQPARDAAIASRSLRDGAEALRPAFPLPPSAAVRKTFGRELRAEPLLEVDHPEMVAMARRLKGRDAMADVVTRRIADWVRDSVALRRPGRGREHRVHAA